MSFTSILIPSKPRIIKEDAFSGVYEIDGLYPGYGHTLGNSLRRIILSSLPGSAITRVKIDGVSHEFSTVSGVKEDVIMILLNLKKTRFKLVGDEAQTINLKAKGLKTITAKDFDIPGQVELLTPDEHIATLTNKDAELNMEMIVEKGLGYVPKESIEKDRVEIGSIALDAIFSPIRRANYEVENMRVGNRTDFNRLRISIETDGTITPHEALEKSIRIMIDQLKAIVGFVEEEEVVVKPIEAEIKDGSKDGEKEKVLDVEFLKTRIDSLGLSPRTVKALSNAGIRTIGGLARKKESDVLEVDGLGSKGVQEIKKMLASYGINLK